MILDYLFDDEMVRSVDGVFQPSLTLANHYKHIQVRPVPATFLPFLVNMYVTWCNMCVVCVCRVCVVCVCRVCPT